MKKIHDLSALEKSLKDLSRPLNLKEAEDEEEEGDDKGDEGDSDTPSESETDLFKKMDDDTVDRFIDGMLIVLGELEQTGKIPPIENPGQAKDAILAAVRRMGQRRALIASMTKKYSRFGAKRVLRKAKQDIGKALS